MQKKVTYVQSGRVGLQVLNGQVLESLLTTGQHSTDAQVFQIEIKQEVSLSLAEGPPDERFSLRFELNQYPLPTLYKQPGWQPIRPAQIGEFVAKVGAAVLEEKLREKSRALNSIATPDSDDFHRAFGRMISQERREFCLAAAEQLKRELDKTCERLLFSASYWINAPARR